MAEQADYLRFMPDETLPIRVVGGGGGRGGPGWVLPGVAKMLVRCAARLSGFA